MYVLDFTRMTSRPIHGAKLTPYLHSLVRLETDRGSSLYGGVVAIDPVSNTAVLLPSPVRESTGSTSVATAELLVVPDVNWDRVRILPTEESTRETLKQFTTAVGAPTAAADLSSSPLSKTERLAQQRRLCEGFAMHGLTAVAADENVVVMGCVTIRPPYRSQDTRATNEIVLERVLKLMNSFN